LGNVREALPLIEEVHALYETDGLLFKAQDGNLLKDHPNVISCKMFRSVVNSAGMEGRKFCVITSKAQGLPSDQPAKITVTMSIVAVNGCGDAIERCG
jgi:hypothetical protein